MIREQEKEKPEIRDTIENKTRTVPYLGEKQAYFIIIAIILALTVWMLLDPHGFLDMFVSGSRPIFPIN